MLHPEHQSGYHRLPCSSRTPCNTGPLKSCYSAIPGQQIGTLSGAGFPARLIRSPACQTYWPCPKFIGLRRIVTSDQSTTATPATQQTGPAMTGRTGCRHPQPGYCISSQVYLRWRSRGGTVCVSAIRMKKPAAARWCRIADPWTAPGHRPR